MYPIKQISTVILLALFLFRTESSFAFSGDISSTFEPTFSPFFTTSSEGHYHYRERWKAEIQKLRVEGTEALATSEVSTLLNQAISRYEREILKDDGLSQEPQNKRIHRFLEGLDQIEKELDRQLELEG